MNWFKQLLKKSSPKEWVFLSFSLLWTFILLMDYWDKHPIHSMSLTYFRYFILTLVLGLSGIGVSMYLKRKWIFQYVKKPVLNGIILLAFIILIINLYIHFFNYHWNAPLNAGHFSHASLKGILTILGTTCLVIGAYSTGSIFIRHIFKLTKRSLTYSMASIAFGFFVYSILLFVLGVLHWLNQPAVIITLFLPAAINFRDTIWICNKILIERITIPESLSSFGVFISYVLLVTLSLNLIYTLAPFPLGFDARTYYVNISKLLSDGGYLVEGFQPYAWSLIMSVGYIAFKSPEITMMISFLGAVLCFFCIYDLAVNHMKISPVYAMACCLLFAATPMVTNQLIIEFKIDLALLFIQLAVLNMLLHWFFNLRKRQQANALLHRRRDWHFMLIIAALLGFSLSIKALSLFIIIGIMQGIWWFSRDNHGVIGFTAMFIGAVFLFELDGISGLRAYHQYVEIPAIASILLGAALMVRSFMENRHRWIQNAKALLVFGSIVFLTFSPWMIKNYSYTKSMSLKNMIIGSNPGPPIDVKKMEANYLKLQEDDHREE